MVFWDFFLLGPLRGRSPALAGAKSILGGQFAQVWGWFPLVLAWFLRLVVCVEVGLRFSLFGAAVDGVDGAAGLAEVGEDFGVAGVAGFDVFGHGDVVAESLHDVLAGDAGGLAAEEVELLEQQVVGGRRGDFGPVGLDELLVGADGGVGDVEPLGDLALGESLQGEGVDLEAASSAFGLDVHGAALF